MELKLVIVGIVVGGAEKQELGTGLELRNEDLPAAGALKNVLPCVLEYLVETG